MVAAPKVMRPVTADANQDSPSQPGRATFHKQDAVMRPSKHYIWDPFVRVFHWSLVAAFCANAFFTRPGKITHQSVGYIVAGLIAARLIWELLGTRQLAPWPT